MPGTDSGALNLPAPQFEGWQEDSTAATEESAWARQDELSKARHANALMIHRTVKLIIPVMLIFGALLFVAMAGTYVAMLLLPTNRRWLEPEQIQQIHSILFSGFAGGALALIGKTYLELPGGNKK